MADLTAIILTRNEEKNIKKCIDSIKSTAKRIVVVDSLSSDNTVEIAKNCGAEVFVNPFINYATQFNWGLDNAGIDTEWVLRIDADEEFTKELVQEINEKLDLLPSDITGMTIKLRNIFMGKWLKHGGMYPWKLLRLFRKSAGRIENRNMDEHIELSYGKIGAFENDFVHHDFKDLEYWIHKHNWYSNREVKDYFEHLELPPEQMQNKWAMRKRFFKNVIYYKLPKFMRAHLFFIYRYYFKLGFLDGKEGRIFCFLHAYWYRFLIDAKIYECEKTGKRYGDQGALSELKKK